MPIHHIIVPDDQQIGQSTNSNGYLNLRGCPVHQIWKAKTFREANLLEQLSLITLDDPVRDVHPTIYERMFPGLQLATLFLRKVLPDLARIRFGSMRTVRSPKGDITERVFTSCERIPREKIKMLEQELLDMCADYRITTIPRNHTGNIHDLGCTACLANTSHEPPYRKVYVQSALSTIWRDYFSHTDWNSPVQPVDKRNSRYVFFAATLIHELAHAVWSQRMLPLVEDEYNRFGKITIDRPEPKFVRSDGFTELGYALEIQLLGGIPQFPHLGPRSDAERNVEQNSGSLILTLLTCKGMAHGRHEVAASSVSTLFDPSLWSANRKGRFPPLTLHLLPNLLIEGDRQPTYLSGRFSEKEKEREWEDVPTSESAESSDSS